MQALSSFFSTRLRTMWRPVPSVSPMQSMSSRPPPFVISTKRSAWRDPYCIRGDFLDKPSGRSTFGRLQGKKAERSTTLEMTVDQD